jgi:cytoskeletal protein RodZ
MGRNMVMVEVAKPDFGNRMKRLREERGVTLRQIADATKIGVAALEALERNDISRLPGGIFSRAFVRSYAIEVGLDPEQTVRDFLGQFPHDSLTVGSPHVRQDIDALDGRRRRSGATVVAVAVTIALIVGVVLFYTLSTR